MILTGFQMHILQYHDVPITLPWGSHRWLW